MADDWVAATTTEHADDWAPVTTPATKPSTTVSGVTGAVTRGLAPYAAGAAVGAAAGAPLAGVGAIPGAIAGAGAVGLTQLATGLYGPIARVLGLPEAKTPREATDAALDAIGVKRPTTATERFAESATSGAAGALTGAGAAGEVAGALKGTPAAVAARLAERPGLQTASGVSGAVAGQAAAEAGAGPTGQTIASMAGGALPYAASGVRAAAGATPKGAAIAAHDAGYVLPPVEAAEGKPSTLSGILSGWSGKIKTQQAMSERNQEVTNRLAPQALGLPAGTHLSEQVFNDVRAAASKAYQAVARAVPEIKADPAYDNAISSLGARNSLAVQFFPEITKNQALHDMVQELKSVPKFPTEAGLEVVKELRHAANANFKAIGDPSKHALAIAQRQAADAIDDLMDRNITASGQPGLVDAYRAARAQIAKSYDLEGATNRVTGDVSARGLARLADKGRPLTDELRTIADTATAFPKSMQSPASFGRNEDWSALDFFGAAGSVAAGHPSAAAAILLRPAARSALLSGRYQNAITNTRPNAVPLPMLLNPGVFAPVSPAQSAASTLGAQ